MVKALGPKGQQLRALREARSNVVPFVPGADRDAAEIGRLWRKACQSLIDSTMHYIECGKALIAKKATMAHGEWMPWLKANQEALGFGNVTKIPQRLMSAAESSSTRNLDNPDDLIAINRLIHGNVGGTVRGTEGTGEFERYTPAEYIDPVRKVLGTIDLDPASCKQAQKTIKAKRFYTVADDGLTKPWKGRVFLNPPYHRELAPKFVDKLVGEFESRRVTHAVMLTNNTTDVDWFDVALRHAQSICFAQSRIRFHVPEGPDVSPTQGQMFFYFGSDVARFERIFCKIGGCVRPSMMYEAPE